MNWVHLSMPVSAPCLPLPSPYIHACMCPTWSEMPQACVQSRPVVNCVVAPRVATLLRLAGGGILRLLPPFLAEEAVGVHSSSTTTKAAQQIALPAGRPPGGMMMPILVLVT